MEYTTIGIDVSKENLDIYFQSSNEYLHISNDKQGYKKLLKRIKESYNVKRIVIEHTGGYQKEAVKFFQEKGYGVCVVNPSKVRNFAKALGVLAKTDRIDAKILAQYGEKIKPEVTQPESEIVSKLQELVKYRTNIVESIKQYKCRLDKCSSKFLENKITKTLKFLTEQRKDLEVEIKNLINSCEEFYSKKSILENISGVGEQTVCVLLSELPELGFLDKRKIVSLCGLAPMNRDSGKMKGKRCIYGGRKEVRNAIYMATVNAIRCNKIIKEHYCSLKNRGKPSKVAMVACMRKLLLHTNSLIKNM